MIEGLNSAFIDVGCALLMHENCKGETVCYRDSLLPVVD